MTDRVAARYHAWAMTDSLNSTGDRGGPTPLRATTVVLFVAVVLIAARRAPTPTALLGVQHDEGRAIPEPPPASARVRQYAWLSRADRKNYGPLCARIEPPTGFARVEATPGSFADWLRYLPTASPQTPVTTARGQVVLAANDRRVAAVVALQPRSGKLLDGANMLLRLRAEYCWSAGRLSGLAFHYTSGHLSEWQSWAEGNRPAVQGRNVTLRASCRPDGSRESFCGYLETLFNYATPYSLFADTHQVEGDSIAPGDVFLRVGKTGSARMVLDVAADGNGEFRCLLGEGGTPAQTFHVLRGSDGSPWFAVDPEPRKRTDRVNHPTPRRCDLRRWR